MVSFSVRSSQELPEIAELLGITFAAFPIQPYSHSIFFRKEESKRGGGRLDHQPLLRKGARADADKTRERRKSNLVWKPFV